MNKIYFIIFFISLFIFINCGDDNNEEGKNICKDIICSNHGSCEVQNDQPKCICDENFHSEGLNCIENQIENRCEGIICSNHGSCEVQNDQPICICDENFHSEGLNCVENSIERYNISLYFYHKLREDIKKITGEIKKIYFCNSDSCKTRDVSILISSENGFEEFSAVLDIENGDYSDIKIEFRAITIEYNTGFIENIVDISPFELQYSFNLDHNRDIFINFLWFRSIFYNQSGSRLKIKGEILESGANINVKTLKSNEIYLLYDQNFNISDEVINFNQDGVIQFPNSRYRSISKIDQYGISCNFDGVKNGNYKLYRYNMRDNLLNLIDSVVVNDQNIEIIDDRDGVFLNFNKLNNKLTIYYLGELSNRDNLNLHFGYNGWNFVNIEGINSVENSGDTIYFLEKPLQKVDGIYQLELNIDQNIDVIHAVFFSKDGEDRDWDNNNQKNYRFAIEFPYIGPYLQWKDGQNIESSITITYHTEYPTTTIIEYGETEQLNKRVVDFIPVNYHQKVLNFDQPNKNYHYRVCNIFGECSKTYKILSGDNSKTNFKFLAIADSQDNGDNRRFKDVVDKVLENFSDIDFIVFPGDMVWDDYEQNWWIFFDKGRDLLGSKPIFPAIGNHDTPTYHSSSEWDSFQYYFGIDQYYKFRYGISRFYSLNSEIPDSFIKHSGEQYIWLERELNQPNNSLWSFVFWHIPPYDAAVRHWSQQGAFRDITELFDSKIDWVLTGHEHLYQRFKPMRYNAVFAPSNSYGVGEDDGVGYIILPPAGNWPGNEIVSEDHEKAHYRDRLIYPEVIENSNYVDSEIGFTIFTIDNNHIKFETYGMGTIETPSETILIDSVEYSK